MYALYVCVYMYVCKTVTGGGLTSPTMAFPQWKGPEAGGFLVYKTACLTSPDLVLESRSGAGDPEDFKRATGLQSMLELQKRSF